MASRIEDRALRIIEQMGLARPVDLEERGVTRSQLYGLVRKGLVVRQGRGVYTTGSRA